MSATTGGSGDGDGSGGKKPEPAADPLLPAASDAGWDDEPPPHRVVPSFPAYVPPAPPPASPPAVSSTSSASTAPASPPAPPAGASSAPPVSAAASEEPLLPATYDENDLRSAVGASPLADSSSTGRTRSDPDDDDDDEAPRSLRTRRTITVSALVAAIGLAVAALVIVGRLNTDRYLLACEAERAVPQQGRGFPPWGARALTGDAWRPLKIAPETRCQPRETEDVRELERLYLAMILDQATALLTAREVTRLDEAEALLKQALLLTRPPERESEKLASERNERRTDIQRLLGDVTYWRASAKLRDAANALGEAAKQFDAAAEQHPRHVSDAPAWAGHARKLAQQLTAGPAGAPGAAPAAGSAVPPAESPSAPDGAALPVEPGESPGEAPAPPATPPDAGVPAGGVLL